MATYYKYAERSADSTINWAEVGKNMTDMLQEETRIREEKKSAIDKATRELGETLSNAPMGDFKPVNEFALEFAGTAQESRLMQDRLLRSGMLKPKDYAIMRQNLNDGTNTMFDLATTYQAEAARKMERMDNVNPAERNQLMETWMMQQAEGLSNLSQTQAVVNPTNGQVSLGRMVEKTIDGKKVMVLSDDPNDVYTVNELNTRMKQDFNYFDVDAAMLQEEAMLGESKSMVLNVASRSRELNTIYTIIDKKEANFLTEEEEAKLDAAIAAATTPEALALAQENKENAVAAYSYKGAEKDIIEKQMVNPWNTMSILTEDVGGIKVWNEDYERVFKPFTPTFSKEEADADPTLIYVEKLPSGQLEPHFSKDQLDLAEDYIRVNLRSKISQSEEAKAAGVKPTSPWETAAANAKYSKAGREETEKLATVGLWNKIMYATDATARIAAIQAVVESPTAKANGITDIDFERGAADNKVWFTVQDADGNVREISKDYDANNMTLESHAELGSIIHGITNITDLNKEIRKSGKSKGFKYESDVSFTGAKTITAVSPRAAVVKAYKDEVEAATTIEEVTALAEDLGLTIEADSDTNELILVDAGGEVVKKTSRFNDDFTQAEIKQAIKKEVTKAANQKVLQQNRPDTDDSSDTDGINTSEYNN